MPKWNVAAGEYMDKVVLHFWITISTYLYQGNGARGSLKLEKNVPPAAASKCGFFAVHSSKMREGRYT